MLGSHAGAIGQLTNALFRLYSTTGCQYCATLNDTQVYLEMIRGTYKGLSVAATGRYHVAWANDSYQLNRYININAGLRWEEQWYAGSLMKYLFNDNWSPRIGVNIDPFGDQHSKIFFNYAATSRFCLWTPPFASWATSRTTPSSTSLQIPTPTAGEAGQPWRGHPGSGRCPHSAGNDQVHRPNRFDHHEDVRYPQLRLLHG